MRYGDFSKRFVKAALLAGVVMGGATLSFAEEGKPLAGPKADAPATQPGRGAMRGQRGPGERVREELHRLLADLKVTPDQHEKIKGVMDIHREKMNAWRSEHQAELKEHREATRAARDAKDEAKLKELREKGRALHADAPKLLDALKEVRGVLTPEQQATFDQRLEEAKERLMRGPGPGPGSPDGRRGERKRGEGRQHREGEPKPSGSGKKLDI